MVIRELMPTGNLKGRLGSQDRRPRSCAITVPLDRSALWQRFRSGLRRERQSWLAPPIPLCEILSDCGPCPLLALPRHAVIGQGGPTAEGQLSDGTGAEQPFPEPYLRQSIFTGSR